jgi:hypothetical protein
MYTIKYKNKNNKRNKKKTQKMTQNIMNEKDKSKIYDTLRKGLKGGSFYLDDAWYWLVDFIAKIGVGALYLFSTDVAKGFYSVFQYIGLGIMWGFGQLWSFVCYIANDINKHKLASGWLRGILVIAGFCLLGWGLTAASTAFNIPSINVGGWLASELTALSTVNLWSVIGSIFSALLFVLGEIGTGIAYLFTGPTIITNLTQIIFCGAGIGMISAFIIGSFKENETVQLAIKKGTRKAFHEIITPTQQAIPTPGGTGNIGSEKTKDMLQKLHKLSTKKMLIRLNSLSKEDVEKIRDNNPSAFMLSKLLGFIIEKENKYEFTEHGVKMMKMIIKNASKIIFERCHKGNCDDIPLDKKTHRKTQKSTEELNDEDMIELKEILNAVEFVHMTSIQASMRENESEIKKGGGKKRRKVNVDKTMSHLKKEDIEWLKQRNPEKFESARKIGIINNDMEMSDIANKIIADGDTIGGISISHKFESFPSQ